MYFFLQNECGWEGLTYGDSVLAESDWVDVPEGASFVGDPRFEYFCHGTAGNSWTHDCSVPTLEEMSYGDYDGRVYAGAPFLACHGIQNCGWIPTEWYTPLKQPCYSDENVYLDMYDNIYAYVESSVNSGKRIGVELISIDISHPDVMYFCQCKSCLKIMKEEDGTNAGVFVRFANRLVEDMRADYDGIKYLMFAYQGTQKPCITLPDRDLYVSFCTDRICANHSIDSDECDYGTFYPDMTNQVVCDWIEKWVEMTEKVYVWHYAMEGGLGSANFTDIIYDDLDYFYRIGVKGVLMCADNSGSSLNRTVFQLEHAINWDKDMTEEEYWAEYERLLEKDYGDGWEYVDRCARLWSEGEDRNGCWHCWNFTEKMTEQYPPYCAEHYDEAYALAERAILDADSREEESRLVKFLAITVYHGTNCSYFYAYDAEDDVRLAQLEERWARMLLLLEEQGIAASSFPMGISGTAEEEAWTVWADNREQLTAQGAAPKEPPQKYS